MKESNNRKGSGWMTISMLVIMVSFFMAAGCAEVKLGTLQTPPQSAKLRVFVKTISGEFAKEQSDWVTPYEKFENHTYTLAKRFFDESGPYEIVSKFEVRLITGKKELPAWRWSKDDWALAVEVGRRLYAEYALIVQREKESDYTRYYRFLLINVVTKKRYEVMTNLSGAYLDEEWGQNYFGSITTLFDIANEDILTTANRKSSAISNELASAKKEILELTKAPEKETKADQLLKAKEAAPKTQTPSTDASKDAKVATLEAKLAKLMETLTQLEEMKKQIAEQKQKSDSLARELAEKEQREKQLLNKLEDRSKFAPVIVLASPRENSRVEVNFVQLSGVVEDEKGLKQLEIYINGKALAKGSGRGIQLASEVSTRRLEFVERVSLVKGVNQLKVRVVDSDDLITEKTVTIHHIEKLKNIWAVVIGIDKYPNIRQLKYAVKDSRLFYDYLVERNLVPAENVTLLLDQDATLDKIKSVLGTTLKNKAGKDDMVIIYFAGHGATEKDNFSPDGDGLEKYLLPFNADLNDLYSTALPMGELSRIFNRISSERLIYIADSCYSGASGGRTIGLTGMRANISDAFMDRVASGKGRVIITASGANEVSAENDDLKHGVFTYYLVEGLKGKADTDKDGIITVDEVYNYVTVNVPLATGQAQPPVKKGSVEGQLIMGIVE